MRAIRLTMMRWGMAAGLAFAGCAAAADRGPLQTFFSEVTTFRANFSQTVFDENKRQLQATSGTMALKRPGKFRWDYVKPYEQHIVGDGRNVYIHDVDLEQVTVKDMAKALGDTPAQLLSTSKPLDEAFRINDDGEYRGLHWFELAPKTAQETSFQRLRLGFADATLQRMEMEDALGNLTLLEFSQPQRNLALDDTLFNFTPPAGVDVIGPDQ